ncbi:MAG TPA: polymer-forming cytoskeletal protein [Spirochaetota bacterium]|mgnify:FL=1|nr:polymer-forming cytoskeletal protein [Spirochaetota bacterium]
MTKKIIQVNTNPVYENGMIGTVFAKDTEFYGDLSFQKSLQINGYFEGEIVSEGFLVVGEGATIKANIKARTVIIHGTVHGNIEAVDRLEIQPSGKLYGNIRTSKLKIADGVVFEGKCEMVKPSSAPERKNDGQKLESA